MNGQVNALLIGPDGTLYAGGAFTTAGGVSANYIARWNASAWVGLGTGMNSNVLALAAVSSGALYAGGAFTVGWGGPFAGRFALWTGYAFSNPGADLPGALTVYSILMSATGKLYVGFDTTGTAKVAGIATCTNAGTTSAYPIITVTGPGTLLSVRNETTGKELLFNLYVNAGETITIDLTPDHKTIVSSWRGNVISSLLRGSDLMTWCLAPDPQAAGGANKVSCFMTGTTGASGASATWTARYWSLDGNAT
jgi:hypothetical protein